MMCCILCRDAPATFTRQPVLQQHCSISSMVLSPSRCRRHAGVDGARGTDVAALSACWVSCCAPAPAVQDFASSQFKYRALFVRLCLTIKFTSSFWPHRS